LQLTHHHDPEFGTSLQLKQADPNSSVLPAMKLKNQWAAMSAHFLLELCKLCAAQSEGPLCVPNQLLAQEQRIHTSSRL